MTQADPNFIKELNSIIAQEARRYQTETLQETDWTLERVMKEHSLTLNQARKMMNHLASEGYFEKIKVLNPLGGGAKLAYRPIEKKKKTG